MHRIKYSNKGVFVLETATGTKVFTEPNLLKRWCDVTLKEELSDFLTVVKTHNDLWFPLW